MLESGQYIADYRIVEPLAENQVFQTYLVSLPESGLARLLLINSVQFPDQKSRQIFQEQAQRLLGHSFTGVCALLEVGSTAQSCFCLYRQPAGQPLNERLQNPYSVRRSLELVQKIAASLSALHSSGFWHGNLSPATIFVKDAVPELVDFSLSSLLQLDFHSSVDPRYSSPEQVRGESISAAADIYSLGILLYRLLVGEVPFLGVDPFAVAMQHVQGEVPRLPEPLAVCQPLLDTLLKNLPEERATAVQLGESLVQLLALPAIEQLPLPEPLNESESTVNEAENVQTESAFTPTDSSSQMHARIEARLKERAASTQQATEQAPPKAQMTKSQRIVAGQRRDQAAQSKQNTALRQKAGSGRSLFFLVCGVALGFVVALAFFRPGNPPGAVVSGALPAPVAEGLAAGGKLLEQGNYPGAEQIFASLVKDYPTYPQPYNNLAAVYAAQGNYQKARNYLESALATDASYAAVYRNLGTIYAEMARDSYGKALQFEEGQQPVKLQVFVAAGSKDLVVGGATAKTAATTSKTPKITAAEKSTPAGHKQVATAESAPLKTVPLQVPEQTQKPLVAVPQPEAVSVAPQKPQPETPEAFLQRWAAAWSAQDTDAYLSFYAANFAPASGKSRADWEQRRRSRLARPASIKVVLSDFAPVRRTAELLQIELTQDYRSDRYSDRTRKRFDLHRKGESWEILAEHSLGRVR